MQKRFLLGAAVWSFAQHIGWPVERLLFPSIPFTVCVVDNPELAGELNKALRSRRFHRMTPRVTSFSSIKLFGEARPSCDISYFEKTNRMTRTILEHIAGYSLTVGTSRRFLRAGGHVYLFAENDKVGFHLNSRSLQHASLQLTSDMYEAADKIES